MGRLIYATNMSLDGFTEDATGSFDWSAPDEEVHEFYNDMMRSIAVQFLGRRMYETMAVWETDPAMAQGPAWQADFAWAWQDSDKIVYSTTLAEPLTKRTRITGTFDPGEILALKERSAGELLVSGPKLAAHALRRGLVDELRVMLVPVLIGSGKPAFADDLFLQLDLISERRFGNGWVQLTYGMSGTV